MKSHFTLLLAFVLALPVFAAPASYDVVVYGGTSGGVVAAVQVARAGKSVVLVSPVKHVGGLTISGLGWTDMGESSILGGISREFYHEVYLHYQKESSWDIQDRASFGNKGQGGPAFNEKTEIGSVFEPKVAEGIFMKFLKEAKVTVVTGRLDLKNGVKMDGRRIAAIRTEGGDVFLGKVFIDASYEGDLLPGAKVSFALGREANAQYGETVNGTQTGHATKNQLGDGIDPYVVKGDAKSGLLPGVEMPDGKPDGSADERLQAYCYRMVLTSQVKNRKEIGKPEDYDEKNYELLLRAIEGGQKSGFFKFDPIPNKKTDSNNHGGISTDFVGMNYGPGWNWATLDHDKRAALAKKHENWQRGFIWTLQNHPRVPEAVRKSYAPLGLPADEFQDNGNWPYDLYVREARRMVSDYVMTEKNCSGSEMARDSIGLAAYAMDSHHVRRQVVKGMVKNEGDIQFKVAKPYAVSYRSIVPKKGECENLLVPWSLSASHMAFGSIRMEPVFMVLSQSAGIAAGMAIDKRVAVQEAKYPELRKALVEAGQALGE